VPHAFKVQVFYQCRTPAGCGCFFQVLYVEGQAPIVVAESPRAPKGPAVEGRGDTDADRAAGKLRMGCPDCGRYGAIKMTYPERYDGKWRRHKCDAHGYYYTQNDDGEVTVHRKMKSLLAVEV
jgi:hypothetical protein